MDTKSTEISTCAECIFLKRTQVRISLLEAQIDQLQAQIRDLREKLNQNSSNSSRPPSSDPPWIRYPSSKQKTGHPPGGQLGHPGHFRKFLPIERVNHVVVYVPERCGRCGHSLLQEIAPDDSPISRHQVVELPPVVADVTEHQWYSRTCPHCSYITQPEIPAEIRDHTLGPRLTAMMALLSGFCHMGKRTIEEFVRTVFEVPVSLGSIANYEGQMSDALAPAYTEVQQTARTEPTKNVDETGWSKKGVICWLWLAATKRVALFKIHAHRGADGLQSLLGQVIHGILTSDRWSAYGKLKVEFRQVCWAHLKRDFQKFHEAGGVVQSLGEAGLQIVREVFESWTDFKAGKISRAELQQRLEPTKERLSQTLQRVRDGPEQKAGNFCNNLLKLYPALWTFVRVEGVEPTNNHAERCLRRAVLWRKRCFGNHSEDGCRFSERILTVVQTLRLQKRAAFGYLVNAVECYRAGQPAPSII